MPLINSTAPNSGGGYPQFKTPWDTTSYTGIPGAGKKGGLSDPKNAGKSMEDILSQMFTPFLNQQISAQGPIGNSFMSSILDPSASFNQALTATQGFANNLFKPGGQIAGQIAGARGKVAGQGFAPSGAERGENGILNQGVSDISNFFSTQAGNLEQQRRSLLGSAFGETNQNIMDLIQSLFSGAGSIGQLGLAGKSVPKGGLLGLGFGPL